MPGERACSSPSSQEEFWRMFFYFYMYMYLPGGGIARDISPGTGVPCETNIACLLIEQARHRSEIFRQHMKSRKRWRISIDKREANSLPEDFICLCTKELDVLHCCCSHDSL